MLASCLRVERVRGSWLCKSRRRINGRAASTLDTLLVSLVREFFGKIHHSPAGAGALGERGLRAFSCARLAEIGHQQQSRVVVCFSVGASRETEVACCCGIAQRGCAMYSSKYFFFSVSHSLRLHIVGLQQQSCPPCPDNNNERNEQQRLISLYRRVAHLGIQCQVVRKVCALLVLATSLVDVQI